MDMSDFLGAGTTPDSGQEDDLPNARNLPSPKAPDNSGRIIRRRARKACVECHKRKVRCDVLSRGQSCTNCRLDGLPCAIRSKDGRRRSQFTKPDVVQDVETEVHPAQEQVTVSGIFNPTNQSSERPSFTPGWKFPSAKPEGSSLTTAFGSSSGNLDMIFSYYGFLEAESLSHIPPEDFKFLEHKGCFHLPARYILDEFVREYFLHVHPVLPILDEGQFWEMYLVDGRGQRRLSLFLFRAMLFVCCSFVSAETLKVIGFQEPLDARTTMYRRAKLLFDFNATSDPIAISQAALLLTYYCSDREPLMNTTWLRIAIQFATSEKVHMYSHNPKLKSEDRLVRKRLWWCCILRDRILPLGVRRPIQIAHEIFDFTQDPLSEKDLESEFNLSQVYDSETKRSLARIFKAQLDLAIVLTDIIALVYPMNSLKSFDFNTLMEMPAMIQRCRERLDRWSSGMQESFPTIGTMPMRHKSIPLFHGMTQIYYHSARAALCQYESFALQANMADKNVIRTKELGSELHSAIASISNIVGKLVEIDVADYLPVSAVAYMALPIILNSIDLQGSSSTTFKNESKRRQLRLYNEAMEICHARYTGTGAALNVINKTIASAKADIFSGTPSEPQCSTSTALLRAAVNKIDDWFEVFVSQPRQYLRIALTIDISLSMGRYAGTDELPRLLLMTDSAMPSPSIPRGLTPVMRQLGHVDVELATPEAMAISAQRRDLDYFDFEAAERGLKSSETSPWNENLADSILEDVLRSSYGSY